MSWNVGEEKLLCFMVLDDHLAQRISTTAGPAFWRGFILQNRKTGEIFATYRFRYQSGERNWMELRPKDQGQGCLKRLHYAMETSVGLAISVMLPGVDVRAALKSFYPPDDEGHPERTVHWLAERDLIEVVGFKKGEPS
jgi:hypothetical protein